MKPFRLLNLPRIVLIMAGIDPNSVHNHRSILLTLLFLELLESSHHVCHSNCLRLPSVLHPPLDQLLYELVSGVHIGSVRGTSVVYRTV